MTVLQGKTAVVTGATKGIGRGIAFALAGHGANVVVVSRHLDECQKTAEEIAESCGVETMPVAADVTQLAQIEALVEKAAERFGKIDILINNAGTAITKKAEDITEQDWDRVLNVDLKGVFFCAQAFGRKMIGQGYGKIVNIASILGLVGDKQVLPYCVAKGGVIQMTKALALEWAKYNITVNALCPGYVITPMNREDLQNEKISAHILKKVPMRRFGEVENMTEACVFLASDASSYMTGQAMVIDGGWTCE